MTDNKPHHEDETPTERLLREALSARASQITAHDLRPAAPPSRRLRRLRPVHAITTISVFGLAAALAFGVVGIDTNNVSKREDTPPAATLSASPSPSPSTSESPSTTPTQTETTASEPSTPETTSYTFHNVSFVLPAGWKVVEPPNSQVTELCVQSPGVPAGYKGPCLPYGIELGVYSTDEEVNQATWPTEGDLDASGGWSHQPYCYSWDNPHQADGAGGVELQTTRSVKHAAVTVAGKVTTLSTWEVSCASGDTFTARMWGLRAEQVYIAANGLKSDYESGLQTMLNSLDVSKQRVLANLDTKGVDWSCVERTVPADDPGTMMFRRVLAAARAKDYATLSALYESTPEATPPDLAGQQKLWREPGVLDQLVKVLTESHPAGGNVYPSIAARSFPTCRTTPDDLKALGVAKASDYHGVRTTGGLSHGVYRWYGITMV